jgi:hypothetical protein
MIWKNIQPQTRLRIIGTVILLLGLISSVAIYIATEQAAASAVGYDIVDGQAYAIPPGSSKRYVHDLEMYGGKAAVMADEFNRWFNGLWQGTSLAYTVAFLTIVTSLGFFFVAGRTGDDDSPESRKDNT